MDGELRLRVMPMRFGFRRRNERKPVGANGEEAVRAQAIDRAAVADRLGRMRTGHATPAIRDRAENANAVVPLREVAEKAEIIEIAHGNGTARRRVASDDDARVMSDTIRVDRLGGIDGSGRSGTLAGDGLIRRGLGGLDDGDGLCRDAGRGRNRAKLAGFRARLDDVDGCGRDDGSVGRGGLWQGGCAPERRVEGIDTRNVGIVGAAKDGSREGEIAHDRLSSGRAGLPGAALQTPHLLYGTIGKRLQEGRSQIFACACKG